MKNMTFVLAGTVLASCAFAQNADKPACGGSEPTTQCETTKPSKTHGDLITSFIGRWHTTSKNWSNANAEPTTATGLTTMTPAMGGRFVKQEFACANGENPFKGTGYFGFNSASGNFESFWIDTLSTGMVNGTGTRENDGTIVWTTTWFDENGKSNSSKTVTSFPNDNTVVCTTYTVANGAEFKNSEVTYTRAGQVTPEGNVRFSFTGKSPKNTTAGKNNGGNNNGGNEGSGNSGTFTTTDASGNDVSEQH